MSPQSICIHSKILKPLQYGTSTRVNPQSRYRGPYFTKSRSRWLWSNQSFGRDRKRRCLQSRICLSTHFETYWERFPCHFSCRPLWKRVGFRSLRGLSSGKWISCVTVAGNPRYVRWEALQLLGVVLPECIQSRRFLIHEHSLAYLLRMWRPNRLRPAEVCFQTHIADGIHPAPRHHWNPFLSP